MQLTTSKGIVIQSVDTCFRVAWGATPHDDVVPSSLARAIIASGTSVKTQTGYSIIASGSSDDDVYLIRSGEVQFSILSFKGREIILGKLGPHHMFGELAALDQKVRSVQVTTIKPTMLTRITASKFKNILVDQPDDALWFMQSLARRIRTLTNRTFDLAALSVNCRVQQALLSHYDQTVITDDRFIITDFPTHESLAAQLGTHREAITRELSSLKREGIISQSGRQVHILSVAKLDALLHRGLR